MRCAGPPMHKPYELLQTLRKMTEGHAGRLSGTLFPILQRYQAARGSVCIVFTVCDSTDKWAYLIGFICRSGKVIRKNIMRDADVLLWQICLMGAKCLTFMSNDDYLLLLPQCKGSFLA